MFEEDVSINSFLWVNIATIHTRKKYNRIQFFEIVQKWGSASNHVKNIFQNIVFTI